MSSQIPLPLGKFDRFSFEMFIAGQNKHVVDNIHKIITSGSSEFLYLWGDVGVGKSHILQAACAQASQNKMKPGYIPLSNHNQFLPEVLNGLEFLDLVCIDDLDSIVGIPEWEKGLFNLFNTLVENSKILIVTSTMSPSGNSISLPDLKSRLASGIAYHLKYLNEDERLYALKQRASLRGFELPNEVLNYLSKRVARDMHTLFNWLDRIDNASLVSKKKLTIALVRQLLDKK